MKKKFLLISAISVFLVLLFFEMFHGTILKNVEYGEQIYNISTRFLGGIACAIFVYLNSSKNILSLKTDMRSFLIFLPCMAVAINNFPFITFFSGEAYISSGVVEIVLYALLCICVGFFEEMAFRGCIFSMLLQRRGKRQIDVFVSIVLSSVIFGVVHLVNVFGGANIGAVVLQVGYSFLIGGMCSVILVKTKNIWYCVVLHAVYNFAGGIVPECGGGAIWTIPTVILTAVVAVIVAAYVIYMLIRISPHDVEALLNDSIKNEQNNIELKNNVENKC